MDEIISYLVENEALQMAQSIIEIPSIWDIAPQLTLLIVPVDNAMNRLSSAIGRPVSNFYGNPHYNDLVLNHLSIEPPTNKSIPFYKSVNGKGYGKSAQDMLALKQQGPLKKFGTTIVSLVNSVIVQEGQIEEIKSIQADNESILRSPSILNQPAVNNNDETTSFKISSPKYISPKLSPVKYEGTVDTITNDISDDYIIELLGKKSKSQVSNRSLIATRRIIADLRKNYPGLKLVKTADNGDCYYDAAAQGLSEIFGKVYTVKQLRQLSSSFINDPLSDKSILERIQKFYKGKVLNEFKNFVHEDATMSLENKRFPVWGNTQADGLIFMTSLGVRIREISEGYMDEGLKMPALADPDNRIYGDVLHGNKNMDSPVLIIANIPGHYFAVLGNTNPKTVKLVSQDLETEPAEI